MRRHWLFAAILCWLVFVAPTAPAVVHVGIQVAKPVRTVDARVFGLNAAAWDSALDTRQTLDLLAEMDNQVLRWPGGSWGDDYHYTNEAWSTGATAPRTWGAFSTNFMHVATNTHAQAFIICNYGSSTPEEAAFAVRMFNVTNHCDFKYWEIGNECYGSWETDNNTNGAWRVHDPWTYAKRFTNYYAQMKAVDPTINLGVPVDPDETGHVNNKTHFAVNPRTGTTNYGWTPVVLSTLNSLGVTPDFVVEHHYAKPQGDASVLASTDNWKSDAASLRRMLKDYLGTNAAANVELVVTEFGPPTDDKYRSSLVGGLFSADTIGQIMQTEFNACLRWDLRNGIEVITNSDPNVYGWRTNEDGYFIANSGVVVEPSQYETNRYPSYYCLKLLKYLARGGDTVVTVTNDNDLLGTYAVNRQDGTLALMVINKSPSSSLKAAVTIDGYVPAANALVYSYGIPQDNAARTGIGSMDIGRTLFTNAGVNFTNTFPPYSATVLSLAIGPLTNAVALSVSGFPSPQGVGLPGRVTVTALDPFGNTASNYTGTVRFRSSDAAAILPADYTFVAGDNGTHTFGVALMTAGDQSITAIDTGPLGITGTQSGIAVQVNRLEYWDFNDPSGTALNQATNSMLPGSVWNGGGWMTDGNGSLVVPGDFGTAIQKLPKAGTANGSGTDGRYATPLTGSGTYTLEITFSAWDLTGAAVNDNLIFTARDSSSAMVAYISLLKNNATNAQLKFGSAAGNNRTYAVGLTGSSTKASVAVNLASGTAEYFINDLSQAKLSGKTYAGNVGGLQLQTTGAWTNAAASVSIDSMGLSYAGPPNPSGINYSYNAGSGTLTLAWTNAWLRLEAQTNMGPGRGLSTNWFPYPGTSPVNVPVNPAKRSGFYRLTYP